MITFMRIQIIIVLLLSGIYLTSCGWNLNAPDNDNGATDPDEQPLYKNFTSEYLSTNTTGQSNSAKVAALITMEIWISL